jgi:hypothetical protein
MTNNLLDPLVLDDATIRRFIREHRCALCSSHFVQYPIKGEYHKYHAVCPEHGPAMQHTIVKVRTVEEVEHKQRKAERELNPLTEEQKKSILESLGF